MIATVVIEGLERPVAIQVDRWGVAHIEAETRSDLFFAQGYNAARDRLWQIDLWRKRGLGLLARDFGAAFIDKDRAARLFLYRGDMAAEWAAYGPDSEAIATAFVAGINAYVGRTRQHPDLLPPEFAHAGTQPDLWAPADAVRIRSHGKLFNFDNEIRRADVAARFGLAVDALRQAPKPDWSVIPTGIEGPIPVQVMETYRAGTEPPVFGEDLAGARAEAGLSGGSNNWAVAPGRSASGRPLLASDPHRAMALPSLRYLVHLKAPGVNVIGAGEPAVPGVSIGHNEAVAFGLTTFSIDQADLIVCQADPTDPDAYLFDGGSEPLTVIEETIEVSGGPPVRVQLAFTRHGPVLHREGDRLYAFRSVWSEPGTAPYVGSLRYLAAASRSEFEAAVAHWRAPPVNHVCADIAGSIAWIAAGLAPVRKTHDGLLPVPGDGRFEWQGFMPPDALPRSVDPETGWVASSNQMNLPAGYAIDTWRVGFEWPDRVRYERIAEVLSARPKHTLADMLALQCDVLLPPATALTALLPAVLTAVPAAAADLLGAWDGRMEKASAAATLFEVWFIHHLIPRLVERLAPGAYAAFEVRETAQVETENLVALLLAPDSRLGAEPTAERDRLLAESLTAAWTDLTGRFGADPAAWTWGKLHTMTFRHPLASQWDVGPVAKAGSGLTVASADYTRPGFGMSLGASFRMVLDVGAWDDSMAINAPGQSGDPRSAHYADLATRWGDDRYFPLAFTPERVRMETVDTIRLEPAK